MKKYLCLLVFLIVSTHAVSLERINADTPEDLKVQIDQISHALSAKKKAEFDRGLAVMLQLLTNSPSYLSLSAEQREAAVVKLFHGKSADDVIAESERLVNQVEKARKDDANQLLPALENKIAELESRKKQNDEIKAKLAKLEILGYELTKSVDPKNNRVNSTLRLTVKNNLNEPVYGIGIKASAVIGKRKSEFFEEINHQLESALVPEEVGVIEIKLKEHYMWRSVDKDADVKVTVEKVLDNYGEAVLEPVFSVNDHNQLVSLKRKLKQVKSTPK